jgi:hypothetical protein
MLGREKPLILQNGIPIPQAYDKDLGDWTEYSTEHIKAIKAELALVKVELQTIKQQQIDGSAKVALKDASDNVVSPATEDKLEQVRQLLAGVATESKLEQARMLLDAINTKDFATSSKQDALNVAVEDLKSELILVKSELANIKANQLSGDQKVTLSGNIMEYYGATVEQRPEATEVPVGAAYMAVNTGDVWQSNGFEWVVL